MVVKMESRRNATRGGLSVLVRIEAISGLGFLAALPRTPHPSGGPWMKRLPCCRAAVLPSKVVAFIWTVLLCWVNWFRCMW